MNESILLKRIPKIEFLLHDDGFELIDGQTKSNSGFYSYNDIQSFEVNKAWYPRLAKWLRIITWIFNGVPYFPDAKSYKKASLAISFRNTRLGIWLTDTYMADKARVLQKRLSEKLKSCSS